MRSNIVITGAAIVSPLGLTREATFSAVLAGRCGIGRLTAIECELPDGRDGGEAPLLAAGYLPGKPREVRYLRKAIDDALNDAGLSETNPYRPQRRALMLGTTLHGMRAAGEYLRTSDVGRLSHFLASHVAAGAGEGLSLSGFSATTCSACSSSLGSIALGVTLLESGDFDVIIAGGYDPVSEYAYAGFNSLRLVAEGPLRPFTRGRTGMKLSEGYGIVILERADDATARKASPLARVAGFGESADAHHLTQPHPSGDGATRAMRQAIADANLTTGAIGLIVSHATGTPDNDASEFAAMKSVFGERLPSIPCVAFKSHLGHTLGGAGAVELILGAMAMKQQMAPPCANVRREDIEFPELNLTTDEARPANIGATMSVSLGFGGANTCVVLTPPGDSPAAKAALAREDHEVVITGMGILVPGAIGNDVFAQMIAGPPTGAAGPIAEEHFAHLINARRVRRLSEYVKLLLAAGTLAMRDAGVTDVASFARTAAAVLGSTHGSTNYCDAYYRQIVTEGIAAANPMLFAEGVPNAGSAHLSLALGIQGACQTIIGSRTAGLDAMALAARRIRTGRWDRAIVGAAEEYSELTQKIYRGCCQTAELQVSSGAVVFLLESREAANARSARIRGTIGRFDTSVGAAGRCTLPSGKLYPWTGELFSVAPLAQLAAALLSPAEEITVDASDPTGITSTVSVRVGGAV